MGGRAFLVKLSGLQPSQLYISGEKLEQMRVDFAGPEQRSAGPIPILQLGDNVILTDGHTRAYTAFLSGASEV